MIKRVYSILLVTCITIFYSCLDTEEKITINKDNSGSYTLTLDMGKMFQLMDQMGGEKKDSSKIPEKKDSTIYFKAFTDTSSTLTVKEKEMFRDGNMRVQVDEAAKEMKVTLHFPFKNISQLPALKSSYLAVIDKLGISKKLNKPSDSDSPEEMPEQVSGNKNILSPVQDAYTFTAAPNKIYNTLTNKELFNNKVINDSSMQMMQQMSLMMGDMNYKTVFVLPAAAKKYKGNNPELSADKKRITFSTTLTDLLNRPEAAEYNVEY